MKYCQDKGRQIKKWNWEKAISTKTKCENTSQMWENQRMLDSTKRSSRGKIDQVIEFGNSKLKCNFKENIYKDLISSI